MCVPGVGHGAAEPGEQTADGLSRQRTASLGHRLPAGGEADGSPGVEAARCSVNCVDAEFLSTSRAQGKAEGEPKVKKGKTLLDDGSDEEEAEEGGDESPEEVKGELLSVGLLLLLFALLSAELCSSSVCPRVSESYAARRLVPSCARPETESCLS